MKKVKRFDNTAAQHRWNMRLHYTRGRGGARVWAWRKAKEGYGAGDDDDDGESDELKEVLLRNPRYANLLFCLQCQNDEKYYDELLHNSVTGFSIYLVRYTRP